MTEARDDLGTAEAARTSGVGLLWLVLAFGLGLGVALIFPVMSFSKGMSGMDPAKVGVGLGIFVCVGLLWMSEALPLAVTALMVPLLSVFCGVAEIKASLAGFADPLIFLFLGGFALAAAMERQGLDLWIARSLIRMGKGRFVPVSCLLFGATAFLSMWMSNTATTAMMIPLAMGILGRMKHGAEPKDQVFLLLGLAYSSSIGGLGMLVGSPPNGIAAARLGISFSQWAAFGVPTVLVMLPAMIAVLYVLCRPDPGMKVEQDDLPFHFHGKRLLAIAIFAVTALCWVFGGVLGGIVGVPVGMDTMVALAAIFALVVTGVIDWKGIARGTDWGVLLLFGGGIALSGVLKDSGSSLFLARLLAAAVQGWPMVLVIAAVVGFVIFLTELSSNTAVAALFVPIFYSVSTELGILPAKIVLPLALAASCAFMLPVATPPNAIVYATGCVPQQRMISIGWVLNLVSIALLTGLASILF